MFRKLILCISILIFQHNSCALEYITGRVIMVEPSYLPGSVAFEMDTGNSACPAGTWFWWQKPDPENNKAVYSTLLVALVSGKKINFVIDDGDTTCFGQHLHLREN